MSTPAPLRLLLGPQRPTRNLEEVIAAAEFPDGPLAVISAGWQEAEGDFGDVGEVAGHPLSDLGLYARAEAVFAADAALATAYRERQDRLQEQQRLYRRRLKQLAVAARQTLRDTGDAEIVAAEQRHAIAQLRALDRHHLHRTELLLKAFETAYAPAQHSGLAGHAAEIRAGIEQAAGVLITGGNVVVLLNRMRLFGLAEMLRSVHVIGWSAGAMVLTGRVVLFHDKTPEGRRDAEVLCAGTGLVKGLVVLPDAKQRLRRRDRLRMTLMSRRFGPDTCAVLDSGAALELEAGRIRGVAGAKRLNRNGRIVGIRVS